MANISLIDLRQKFLDELPTGLWTAQETDLVRQLKAFIGCKEAIDKLAEFAYNVFEVFKSCKMDLPSYEMSCHLKSYKIRWRTVILHDVCPYYSSAIDVLGKSTGIARQ